MHLMHRKGDTTLLCLNTNGLHQTHKRSQIVSHFLYPPPPSSGPEIVCFQETHCSQDLEQVFLQSFQYDCTFANKQSQVGGLITAFRWDLDYTVHDYISLGDPHNPEEPKALLVHCSVRGIEMVIANVYITPCSVQKKREDFLNKVTDTWTEFGCPNIICCGDFNSVMDPSIDAIDADPKATPIHTSCVLRSFAEESELVDVYRVHNPITR